MRRDKIPNEQKDRHDDMLRDGNDVRAGHFQDLNSPFGSGIQVYMVGSYTCRHTDLEVLCLYAYVLC